MKPKDFPFAVQLANTMDWNMAESDFEFITKLEPDGCFVLFQAEEPLGIATCVSYGKTGWFGNLVVKEEHRKEGAGTSLVKHAIEYLQRKGVETVGLYAYSHLVRFYEKVGFKPHDDFVVLNGKPSLSKPKRASREAGKNDIAALIDFDKRCFGWERKRLLKSILFEKGNLCYFSVKKSEVEGFVAAKVYEKMAEMGPLVCREEDVAADLVKNMLSRLRNLDVYVYAPENGKAIITTLLDAGLKANFLVTRMFLGPVNVQGCIYLPESLERG
ncbi:MAG TPA: GNAT family N-acetyltransferase [Candidatus Bathyarchaeia archaeon]|nr:GNAT family N-acetyltransferase [Candidatus Bathyarchaeia archaeon]